jgi:hypothetical protein
MELGFFLWFPRRLLIIWCGLLGLPTVASEVLEGQRSWLDLLIGPVVGGVAQVLHIEALPVTKAGALHIALQTVVNEKKGHSRCTKQVSFEGLCSDSE